MLAWFAKNYQFVTALTGSFTASVGLLLNFFGAVQNGRKADVSNYFEITKHISEAQRRVKTATSDEMRQFELIELLNLIETITHLYNHGRFGSLTKEMVSTFLIETIAILELSPTIQTVISTAITSATTFQEIGNFNRRFQRQIKAYKLATEALVADHIRSPPSEPII